MRDDETCAHKSINKPLPAGVGFLSKENTKLLDQQIHSAILESMNFAPPAIANALFDWWVNLLFSPGKQIELMGSAAEKHLQLYQYLLCKYTDINPEVCAVPLPQDRRFDDEGWRKWPYDVISQSFLLIQNWWQEATSDVRGVSQHHAELLPFMARQMLDVFSPLNFPLTNPVVMRSAQKEQGENYLRGWQNYTQDIKRSVLGKRSSLLEQYKVGSSLAVTPGHVVYQNELIELIHYTPTTKTVVAEPILIVPAWIMKYYILDLSPHNSLVKYLVDQGHNVFMISWKNPTAKDAELGLEDYLNLGVMAALNEISKDFSKINAAGYCLGGTLLSIAAAKMARDGDDRLNSMTLLAAQIDFEDAGELLFFIDEAQLAYLEDSMAQKGYLEASKMSRTFNMLRSYDLIWSRMVEEYLLGHRGGRLDLMAWNADTTRMPYKMHSEYLRNLFLNNELSRGTFKVDGKGVLVSDIKVPLFAVSTQKDHVSPWESVYKIHLLINSDITFVLASGGHNAGIIAEPGNDRHKYQILHHQENETHVPIDLWRTKAAQVDGSWWPAWDEWLKGRSSRMIKSPKQNKGIRPAPGLYVLEK